MSKDILACSSRSSLISTIYYCALSIGSGIVAVGLAVYETGRYCLRYKINWLVTGGYWGIG